MERTSQILSNLAFAIFGTHSKGLYQILDPGKEEIRLVTIVPGTGHDSLECKLQVVSFAQAQEQLKYQALSYAWGDPDATNEILLNGCPFHVTRNLHAALHRLRNPTRSRIVWIDAICINQQDTKERNHQVQMMRKIFLLASEVLVFLDDITGNVDIYSYQELHDPLRSDPVSSSLSTDTQRHSTYEASSDLERNAVRLLQLIASAEEDTILDIPVLRALIASCNESNGLPVELKAISTWFSSQWWSRVWVVQEITVPEHASLICGPYLVPWATVASAAANLYRSSLRHDSRSITGLPTKAFGVMRKVYTRVLELESTRVVRTHGRDLGALEVLWTYRHRHASDDRDHVYGLIGLLPGHFSVAGITPQYELQIAETFTDVTIRLLRASRSLTSLIGTWRRAPDRNALPSWVQDWSYSWSDESYSGLHQFLALHKLFRACRVDIDRPGDVKALRYPLVEGSAINLQGAEVDTISEIGEPMHDFTIKKDAVFRNTVHQWLQLVQSRLSEVGDEDSNRKLLETFWRTIRFDLEFRYEGRILGLRGPDVFRRLSDVEIPDIESLTARLREMNPADFAIVKLLNLGRRFFVTTSGRMGLGPHTIQSGDKIFVLWGGDVPFVLRAHTRGLDEPECPGDGSKACLCLVGDCYLHGVMDGGKEYWGDEQMIHLH